MAKKKIKELTLEEANKICTSNSFCSTCPLWINNNCVYQNYSISSKEEVNKEIEVEDEPQKYKSLKGLC